MEVDSPQNPEDLARVPWQRRGAVRRDCEPHRGRLLLLAATSAAGLAFLSELLLLVCAGAVHFGAPSVAVFHPLVLTTCLPGFGFGFIAWQMACRDLSCMQRGAMEPSGEFSTWVACGRGASAAFISFIVLAGWCIFNFVPMTPIAWAVLVPVGLCALVFAGFILAWTAPDAICRLQEQYRRRGLLAVGTVQTVSPSEGSGWHVQYRFSDASGRQYRSYAEFPDEEKPAIGDPIQIVYLPENPRFCDIAANWLDAGDENKTSG